MNRFYENDFISTIKTLVEENPDTPILIMMVGIQGSGKSTIAQHIRDKISSVPVHIFSSDQLREELFGSVDEQNRNNELFRELHRRIKQQLNKNSIVIYDATNVNKRKRKAFLNEINYIKCIKVCACVMTSYHECFVRCKTREEEFDPFRNIPEDIITRTYKNWQPPHWSEGWDHIEFISEPGLFKSPLLKVLQLREYSQNNPHHKLSLGDHILAAIKWLMFNVDYVRSVPELYLATLIHDLGKPFCYSLDEDGVAHYYNHENVGAYESYFYTYSIYKKGVIIDVMNLIFWHMLPYNPHSNKALDRIKNEYGKDFYDRLMLLHEADKAAH